MTVNTVKYLNYKYLTVATCVIGVKSIYTFLPTLGNGLPGSALLPHHG